MYIQYIQHQIRTDSKFKKQRITNASIYLYRPNAKQRKKRDPRDHNMLYMYIKMYIELLQTMLCMINSLYVFWCVAGLLTYAFQAYMYYCVLVMHCIAFKLFFLSFFSFCFTLLTVFCQFLFSGLVNVSISRVAVLIQFLHGEF